MENENFAKLKSEIMVLVGEEFSKSKKEIVSILVEANKSKQQQQTEQQENIVDENNNNVLNNLPPPPNQEEEEGKHDHVEELPPPPPPPTTELVEEQQQNDNEEEVNNYNNNEEKDDDYYKTVHPLGITDTYEDVEYFSSYSKVSLHNEMVFDKRRTAAYYHAISKSKGIFKDKVVLDVGCGTGILSCFVAKAGAKRVYAVDASDMAHTAELIVQRNGLGDIVKVIKGKLEHIAFPEYVDIIVSEWMGSFLIFESMLESVIYARDNLLKANGLLLPSKACIYLSPIKVEQFYNERINQWNDVFDLDMSPIIPLAQDEYFNEKSIRNYYIDEKESVLDSPIILRTLDLSTITIEELSKTILNFEFKVPNNTKFHGFGTWFSVWFENLDNENDSDDSDNNEFIYYTIDKTGELVKGNYEKDEMEKGFTPMFFKQTSNILELSTAPGTGDQHWKQVLFLNPKEKILFNHHHHHHHQDNKDNNDNDNDNDIIRIKGTIRVNQNNDYRRHWWIEISTSIHTKPLKDYSYSKYLI